MSEETEGYCQSCGHEFDADAHTECPKCGWPDDHVEFEPEEGEPDYVGEPVPVTEKRTKPSLPWHDLGGMAGDALSDLQGLSRWEEFAGWLHHAVERRFVHMQLTNETLMVTRAFVGNACQMAREHFDLPLGVLHFDVVATAEPPGEITLVPVDEYAKQSTAATLRPIAAKEHSRQTVAAQAMVEPARPLVEWSEDDGDVMWWKFPIVEPPYVGSPIADDFPDYVTHFTKIPVPEVYSNGDQFKLTFKLEVTLGLPELYPDGDQPFPLTEKDVMRLINLEGGPGKVLTSWDLLGCNEKAVTVKVTALDKQLKSIDHPSERKKEGPTR